MNQIIIITKEKLERIFLSSLVKIDTFDRTEKKEYMIERN